MLFLIEVPELHSWELCERVFVFGIPVGAPIGLFTSREQAINYVKLEFPSVEHVPFTGLGGE